MISEEALIKRLRHQDRKKKTTIIFLVLFLIIFIIPAFIWSINQIKHEQYKMKIASKLIVEEAQSKDFSFAINSIPKIIDKIRDSKLQLFICAFLTPLFTLYLYILIRGYNKERLILHLLNRIEELERKNTSSKE